MLSNQGRTQWRNCRLTARNPNCQLGWAILAECRQHPSMQFSFSIVKILPTLPVTYSNGYCTVCPLWCSLLSNTWSKNWVDFFFIKLKIISFSDTVIKVRENWSETVEVPKDRRGAARGATGPSPVQVRQRKPQRKPQKRIRRMSSTNRGTMAQEAQPITCSSNSSSLTCKLGYGDSGLSLGLKKYM